MESNIAILDALLEAYGIESEYTDTEGQVHYPSLREVLRVLRQKGVSVREDLFCPGPNILVASAKNPPEDLCITVLGESGLVEKEARGGLLRLNEYFEAADEMKYAIDEKNLLTGAPPLVNRVAIRVPYPKGFMEGRYRFRATAELGKSRLATDLHWFVCPDKCYLPPEMEGDTRLAGISLALYGLRSQKNWGVGDFSDLKRVIDWAADDLGVDFVGINPLHAIFNKSPFNASPYLPSSRLYQNYIYLDVPAIEDFNESEKAKVLASLPATRTLIGELRDRELVDYESVAALKLAILRESFRTFLENNASGHRYNQRWEQFEKFRESQGEFLRRFSLFCALREHVAEHTPHSASWLEWPLAYHNPEGEAVRDFERENQQKVLFWMYLQWQLHLQLSHLQEYALGKGMLLGLYNDLALAVDRAGADCWSWQDFFHEGFTIGAPPDSFSPHGQDWGVPPPNREVMRQSGYELFVKNLEANCCYGGALRIDHIMQFNHLFWISEGCTPSEGVYVKEYEEELLNLVALESHRSKTVIVGEDLGTLPHGLRERLMEKGIFSYRLFYFEQDVQGKYRSFRDYPVTALVSISTHDLPTLAGFWAYLDIGLRREMGLIDASREQAMRDQRTTQKALVIERLFQDGFLTDQTAHPAWASVLPTDELHSAVLSFVLNTPSRLALISQEDLFLDTRQQNFPGTTSEHANWVTKMKYSVEDLTTNNEACRMAQKFRRLVAGAGRRNRT